MSNFPIVKATPEEAINVDTQLTNFVCEQVPFTQQQTQIFLNYVIKEDGVVIAGINADLYCCVTEDSYTYPCLYNGVQRDYTK